MDQKANTYCIVIRCKVVLESQHPLIDRHPVQSVALPSVFTLWKVIQNWGSYIFKERFISQKDHKQRFIFFFFQQKHLVGQLWPPGPTLGSPAIQHSWQIHCLKGKLWYENTRRYLFSEYILLPSNFKTCCVFCYLWWGRTVLVIREWGRAGFPAPTRGPGCCRWGGGRRGGLRLSKWLLRIILHIVL